MDFVGNALAPNVLLIKRHLADLSAKQRRSGKPKLDYCFPRRGEKDARSALVLDTRSCIGLQAGFGFAPFLDDESRAEIFGNSSSFVAAYPKSASRLFERSGLLGPFPLTVYSVSPFVMMVDRAALGPASLPRRWEDLLDARFEGKIVTTAEDSASNVAMLSFYALFGPEGARMLFNNIARTVSASVMPSLAKQGDCGASVFIIPWFFARCCTAGERIVMVWPEEGAFSFPLWLALRKGAPEGSRVISSFFTGDDFARECARACLPAVNAASDGELDATCRDLHWVGWDYLENLDTSAYASFVDSLVVADGETNAR